MLWLVTHFLVLYRLYLLRPMIARFYLLYICLYALFILSLPMPAHIPILLLPSEDRIQQSCYVWYNNTYCLPHHSPIVRPSGVCLWVEVKDHKGRQLEAQIIFQERVRALGYTYILVRSLEAFKEAILALQ